MTFPFAMMPGQIQRTLSGTISEARTSTTLGPCRFCSLLLRVAGGEPSAAVTRDMEMPISPL